MKKTTKIFAAAITAVALISSVGGAAQKPVGGVSKVDYRFMINGEMADASKYLVMSKNSTTYVPLRFIAEKLGAAVDFAQGQISINMVSTPSKPIAPSDAQKMQELEKKYELVLKENKELREKIDKANERLQDKNVYKKLPLEISTGDDFKIKLNRLSNEQRGRTTLNITLTNTGDNNFIYFKPELTILNIDGRSINLETYATHLESTIPTRESKLGEWSLTGDLDFAQFEEKGARGYITLYYDVNNSNTRKSQTIYFQN